MKSPVPIWIHDDVIKWKHFPRYWPFVRGIHRSPVNSPHKDQWRGALMFSLICVCINGWVNNREAGDLRHYRAHYDVTVMLTAIQTEPCLSPWWCGRYGVSNHWQLYSLFKSLTNLTAIAISKRHIPTPYNVNPSVTGEFPSQRASNGESVSMA